MHHQRHKAESSAELPLSMGYVLQSETLRETQADKFLHKAWKE